MLRRPTALLLSWILTLLAPAGAMATDPLAAYFGRDVDIVIRLAEPDRTFEALGAFVDSVQPGTSALVGNLQQQLGAAILNPELIGVDQSRDFFAAVTIREDDPPLVVYAIPAVDVEGMIAALEEGEEIVTRQVGNYVIYAQEDVLPAAPAAGVAGMSERIAKIFASGGLSVYVNAKALTTRRADALAAAHDKVLEGLNSVRHMPQQEGVNIQAVIDMYGQIFDVLFQVARDTESLAFHLQLDDEGIRFNEVIELTPETASSKELAKLQTDAFADLNRLPAEQEVYMGFSGGLKELTKWSITLTAQMFETPSLAFEEASEKLDAVDYRSMSVSVGLDPDADSLLNSVSITRATPIEELRDYTRGTLEAMKELKMPGFKQTSTLQRDVEHYGDVSADLVVIQQEFDEENFASALQQRIQNLLAGEGGMQTRVVYLPDQMVSTVGGGQQLMREQLARTTGSQPLSVRADLMPTANFLLLWDIARTASKVLDAASRQPDLKLPVNAQMLDSLNLAPTYAAVAIGHDGDAVRVEGRMPIEQVQGLAKLGLLVAMVLRQAL